METTSNLWIEIMSVLALGALGYAAIIFYKRHSLKNNTTSHTLPPGPKGYPIIGCLPAMIKNWPPPQWMNKIMQEFDTEIACIRLGNVHVIPFKSPELAREFLKKHDAVFASRPDVMSARIASNNYAGMVLTASNDKWKKMRKIIVSELLSSTTLQWTHEKRRDEADHLVRWVYNRSENGGLVNLRDVTRHFCANLIRKMVLGRRFFGPGAEDGGPGFEEREEVEGMFTILDRVHAFAIADYVPWLEFLDLDGNKKLLCNAYYNVTKYHDLEIRKRVEMWKKGVRQTKEDILDVLINLKDSENTPLFSIQDLKGLVLDLILATVDNPSNAVEWAMAQMMNQPHIMAKATKELDRAVGKDRLVQESDLPKLNYVKACLKESFRLHPLSAFDLTHVATKDSVVAGYFIPKGSHVRISRPGLGRNPRVWEDALEYKPERHIKDDGSEIVYSDPELNMFSFSTGRRGCVGVTLGSTITTMLLARLLQGFSWSPRPNVTNICLDESDNDGSMAKPLILQARPRLDAKIHLQLQKN